MFVFTCNQHYNIVQFVHKTRLSIVTNLSVKSTKISDSLETFFKFAP